MLSAGQTKKTSLKPLISGGAGTARATRNQGFSGFVLYSDPDQKYIGSLLCGFGTNYTIPETRAAQTFFYRIKGDALG